MSEKAWLIISIMLTVVLMAYAIWQTIAFYNYPCEAFKSGMLSLSYAPGRCVQ